MDLLNPVQNVNDSKNGEKHLYFSYFHIDRFKLLGNKLGHTLQEYKNIRTEAHRATCKLKTNNVAATALEELNDTLGTTPLSATECKPFATSVADAANKIFKT